MGTFTKGILGGFSGKVGTVIGSTWKGITYMKSLPTPRSGPASQAQIEQQARFTLMIKFMQPFLSFVNTGFKNYGNKMTGFNSAMSYNLKNAVTGVYPFYEINYPDVLVTRGDLPNGGNPQAVSVSEGTVQFTWSDNSGTGKAKAGDKAMLMVYCPELKQAIYTTGSAPRSLSTETLAVSSFSGKEVETYIGFISEDGRDVATSVYTGSMTVS